MPDAMPLRITIKTADNLYYIFAIWRPCDDEYNALNEFYEARLTILNAFLSLVRKRYTNAEDIRSVPKPCKPT